MNVQALVNLASALIVFIGGLVIVFFYPGPLSNHYRILIVLGVTVYFLLRMGQAIVMIRRDRRRRNGQSSGAANAVDDGYQ
jgi:hypothetical protein